MKRMLLALALVGTVGGCASPQPNYTYAPPPSYPVAAQYAPGPVYQAPACTCQPVAAAPTAVYRPANCCY